LIYRFWIPIWYLQNLLTLPPSVIKLTT
jgi:hypothetical protein